MEPESLDLEFKLIAVDSTKFVDGSEVGTFAGLASTFGNLDSQRDIVEPGAFRDSIRDPSKVRMLWMHNARQPIGTWKSLKETKAGLEVKGQLILDVQQGREAYALLKSKAIDALSIGYTVPEGGAEVDRRIGARHLKKINLWEVSLVTFPANVAARVGRVKASITNGELPSRPDLQRALCGIGFSVRQAKKLLPTCYEVLSPEEAERQETLEGLRRLATTIKSARTS